MLSKKQKKAIQDFSLQKFMKQTQQSLEDFFVENSISESDTDKAKNFYSKSFKENIKLEEKFFNDYCFYWQDDQKEICRKKSIFTKLFNEVQDRQSLIDLLDIVLSKGQLEESDSNNPDL
tara:strand:- start:14500 stop:14859 length:360 start_codon:yes stop_codon:yes gene_type:complete